MKRELGFWWKEEASVSEKRISHTMGCGETKVETKNNGGRGMKGQEERKRTVCYVNPPQGK